MSFLIYIWLIHYFTQTLQGSILPCDLACFNVTLFIVLLLFSVEQFFVRWYDFPLGVTYTVLLSVNPGLLELGSLLGLFVLF